MRIIRAFVAACAVIYALHASAADETQVPAPVTEVPAADHPDQKRSVAVYLAAHFWGADRPFPGGYEPFIVNVVDVPDRVRQLRAPDVVVEVCKLVPQQDGMFGPPPYTWNDRVAAECIITGRPQ